MSVWFNKDLSLVDFAVFNQEKHMADHLGIEWTELGDNFIKAKMPVDHRTKQPHGLLHGGASCVLAETLGSVGAALVVDPDKFHAVGIEINANHVRSARNGYVTGVASPLHIGASTQVWDIKIYDEREKLICISRLTVAIVPRR